MKWYRSPSWYKYCICKFSMRMSCTRSPDWNVFSNVEPVRMSRTLVRMVALPRPGLLCEYSSTRKSRPSSSNVVPLRRSFTSIIVLPLLLILLLAFASEFKIAERLYQRGATGSNDALTTSLVPGEGEVAQPHGVVGLRLAVEIGSRQALSGGGIV